MADDDLSLRAIANETRRHILRLVRDQGLPVGHLAEELGMSQPAVSQHLAVLRAAGLVEVEPDGRRRLYRADVDAVARAGAFFADYWGDAVDRLAVIAEADARRAQEADRARRVDRLLAAATASTPKGSTT